MSEEPDEAAIVHHALRKWSAVQSSPMTPEQEFELILERTRLKPPPPTGS